jgi:hypothetical protein
MKTLLTASILLSSALVTSSALASNDFEHERENESRRGNCGNQPSCDLEKLSLTLSGGKNGTLISKADSDTSNDSYTLNFDYQLDTTHISSALLKIWLRDDSTSVDDSNSNGIIKDKREYARITSINGSNISSNWSEVDGYKKYISLDVRDFLSTTGFATLTAVLGVKDSGSKDYYFKAAELYVKYCLNGNNGGGSPITSVPVPAAAWLMGTGLVGLLGFNTRRQRQA